MITGTIASNGINVTLDSGITLPTWLEVGAQVSAYKNGKIALTQVGLPLNEYNPTLTYQWSYAGNPAVWYQGAGYQVAVLATVPPNTPPPNSQYWVPLSPYSGLLPTNRLPRIASIANDRKSFTLTTDTNGRAFTYGGATTGARFYIGQLWTEAMQNGVWQNCNTTPPTSNTVSLGAGFFGADGGISISQPISAVALGQAGITLWLYADTFWTTAAGASKAAGAYFIHNTIAVQSWSGSAPDAGVDTQVFHRGGGANSVNSLIPSRPPANFVWLGNGLWREDNTLILQGFSNQNDFRVPNSAVPVSSTGDTAFFISNPTDDPSLWNLTEIPYWGGVDTNPEIDSNFVKEGSYYYALSRNPSSVIMVRYPASDIEATPPSMMNPEWWCGQEFGWVGTWAYDSAFPTIPTMVYPILLSQPEILVLPDSQTGLFQDSGGNWLICHVGNFMYPQGIRVRNLGTSLEALSNVTANDNSTFGDLIFSPPSDVAISPGNNIWLYACKSHPEQTWDGKTAGDIAISYANNNFGGTADNANYWVQTLRVAGL